jgi:hypothetical protein
MTADGAHRLGRALALLFRALERHATIAGWSTLILAAMVFFALTLATTYHQLAMGLLTSAIVLPCCLIIFEIIWQAVAAIADFLGEEAKNRPGKF